MADYTLFTNPMSRGQIARWALHEAGADYDTQLVEWDDRPQALLDANPMGKIPTLIHHHNGHDHVITECAAICHYLGAMQAPELTPKAEETADYFRYFFFVAGPAEQAITTRAMGWSAEDPQKQMMLGYGTFDKAMDTFEALMTGRDYVCGDRFTMADVYVGSQVDWGLTFGSMPSRPAFEDYAARLRERPAYKEAKAIDARLIEERQNG